MNGVESVNQAGMGWVRAALRHGPVHALVPNLQIGNAIVFESPIRYALFAGPAMEQTKLPIPLEARAKRFGVRRPSAALVCGPTPGLLQGLSGSVSLTQNRKPGMEIGAALVNCHPELAKDLTERQITSCNHSPLSKLTALHDGLSVPSARELKRTFGSLREIPSTDSGQALRKLRMTAFGAPLLLLRRVGCESGRGLPHSKALRARQTKAGWTFRFEPCNGFEFHDCKSGSGSSRELLGVRRGPAALICDSTPGLLQGLSGSVSLTQDWKPGMEIGAALVSCHPELAKDLTERQITSCNHSLLSKLTALHDGSSVPISFRLERTSESPREIPSTDSGQALRKLRMTAFGAPLLLPRPVGCESGRGLPHSKTLARSSSRHSKGRFLDSRDEVALRHAPVFEVALRHLGRSQQRFESSKRPFSPTARRTSSPMLSTLRFAVVCFLLAFSTALHAATPAPSAPETVIVPYDASKPLKMQHPDGLYVPYDRFMELWDAAKRTRRGTESPLASATCLLESARYDGVLAADCVTFRGLIDLSTFNEPWVAVPLAIDGAVVNSVKLDGVAVAFDNGRALIEKPGRHTVEVAFRIPLKRGATTFDWGIPRTPGTLVSLKLPSTRMHAAIRGGPERGGDQESGNAPAPVVKIVEGQKTVSMTLGETSCVFVTLDSSTTLTRMTQPALARIAMKLEATRTLDLISAEFEFSFPAAQQDRFTVFLDPAATLVDLEALNVKSWKLTKGPKAQTLEIVLNEPAKDKFSFGLRCERPVAALPAEMAAPYFGASAQRVENEAALLSDEGIELTPEPGAGFRQIVWSGKREPGMRVAGAYAFGGAGTPETPAQGPAYRIRQAEIKREARVDYVYQVDRRKIELIASLNLDAKGRDLFSATVSVPAGFSVEAVRGERLADWWLDGNALRVRFSGATPEKTPLMIYLVRRYAAAPEKLELAPLALGEFDTVRGEAVIAAHKGVAATLEISGDAKELAPELAARDFSILPPLERKRGFSFTAQTFRGTVTLGTQAVRMNSTWVMDGRVHESWVSLSTRVETSVRQGSVEALSFSLPVALPEAHVTGPEIREAASKLAGDRRVYNVVFQNDIYDSAGFTIDLELPSSGGTTALPALEIAGQDRTSGFVLVENVSENEMALAPTGLDPARRDEIPFLPDVIQSASLFRAHPGWALGISTTRLEKAASRAAFVAWVEITTAFRADGTEWNRAVYRLQNRSLQFLPVKLPEGAELVSVRVAGASTRADAGQVEKQEVVLVPLIKTKQGDLSFEVELVYRMPAETRGELGAMAHRRLHDPALVGVSVEKTLWNLYVPGDRQLGRISGNMQPVIEEVNRTEKLAESLKELKGLASVASSVAASSSVRQNAFSNYAKLEKQLETDMKVAGDSAKKTQSFQQQRGLAQKDADSQMKVVSQRAGELQSELGQIRQGAGTLNIQSGNTYTGATQVTGGKLAIANGGALDFNGRNRAMGGAAAWARNAEFSDKSALGDTRREVESSKRKTTDVFGQNLGINDFVVLNQLPEESSTKAGLRGARKALGGGAALSDQGRSDAFDGVKQKGISANAIDALLFPAQRKLRELQQAQAFTGFVHYGSEVKADANAVRLQPSGEAVRRLSGNRDEAMGSSFGFAAGGAGAVTAAPTSTTMPQNAPALEAPAAAPSTDQPQDAESQSPRPSGRISLPVAFPTEGQAVHFQKLKSNATLELWIQEPAAYEHWRWFGEFVLLALALMVLGFLLDRFVRRAG